MLSTYYTMSDPENDTNNPEDYAAPAQSVQAEEAVATEEQQIELAGEEQSSGFWENARSFATSGFDKFEKSVITKARGKSLEWTLGRSKEFERLMVFYDCAIKEIRTKLEVLNQSYSIEADRNPISTIKSRVKSQESILDKLGRKGYPYTLKSIEENLNDIAGLRVICYHPEDVYAVADALLRQSDITLIEQKDYIAEPKPSGYRSLHLIISIPIFLAHETKEIKAEIQLRTIAMNFWASLEHQIRYKNDGAIDDVEMNEELLACAEMASDLDNRMNALHKRVYGTKKSTKD